LFGRATAAVRHLLGSCLALDKELEKIVGTRHILIHGYAEVNDLTVWRAATEELGDVVTAVDALLEEAGSAAPA
jgi:uncharacterized protein with HEPN domain